MLGKGAKVVPNTLDQISILTRGFLADLGGLNPDAEETVGGYRSAAGRAYEARRGSSTIWMTMTRTYFPTEGYHTLAQIYVWICFEQISKMTFDSSSPNEIMLFKARQVSVGGDGDGLLHVLKMNLNATEEDLKKSYRRMAMK
ncbi:hypothetical protein GUJ93_ZPchr0005g15528 [Zizania palustris]|uniref:Uncharacterized protein n=1 Tax=Zizania palustris TaxID=103762 RepID=A0A8J5SNZ4_ZIZPA|nr:hypothetical protein GUJ93_ZPchr0005g15528 [Zizania palustris]